VVKLLFIFQPDGSVIKGFTGCGGGTMTGGSTVSVFEQPNNAIPKTISKCLLMINKFVP
jgi:hypothetical protein